MRDQPYTGSVKPIRGGLASGVLAVLGVLVSSCHSWATYPGANGRIAYSGHPDYHEGANHSYNIYTVLPDGSGLQQGGRLRVQPLVVGGWTAIGLHRGVAGAPGYQVFRMRADGANQVRVTYDRADDFSPGFSPSGRRIVYAKDNGTFADEDHPRRVSVYTIRSNGTDPERIVTGFVRAPKYSPDGRRIVFEGDPKGKRANAYSIWSVGPNGSHLRRLSNPGEDFYDEMVDTSPDGKHILFRRCDINSVHGCDGDEWLMRSDGSHEHPLKGTGGSVYSPAGDRFAFSRHNAAEQDAICADVYTVPINGTNFQLVTHFCEDFENGGVGGYAFAPSWQPILSG